MSKPIKTAMLIDDETIDLRQYRRVLTRSGMVEDVLAFSYADEALDYLKANPDQKIDVIFLDINMPRMDGFEFLEAISHELGPSFSSFVVAMLTTSLNPDDERRAKSFNIVKAYISKPLTADHIANIVEMI